MTTRSIKVFTMGAAFLLALLVWTGCGNDTTKAVEELKNLPDTLTQMEQNMQQMSQKVDQFKSMEFTVEVVEDGKTTSKWTQKDGSWRYDNPSDPTSYTIYNKKQNKTWIVSGNTAVESSGDTDLASAMYNPVTALAVFALAPKTGGSDDVWELGFGGDSITIEFKGPEGLPTKMTSVSSGDTNVTEYKYSNVGSVKDSTFELPSNVQVTNAGSNVTVPAAPSGSSPY